MQSPSNEEDSPLILTGDYTSPTNKRTIHYSINTSPSNNAPSIIKRLKRIKLTKCMIIMLGLMITLMVLIKLIYMTTDPICDLTSVQYSDHSATPPYWKRGQFNQLDRIKTLWSMMPVIKRLFDEVGIKNWWIGAGTLIAMERNEWIEIDGIKYPFVPWDSDIDIEIDYVKEKDNIQALLERESFNDSVIPFYVELMTQKKFLETYDMPWIHHGSTVGFLSSRFNGFRIEIWAKRVHSKKNDRERCPKDYWSSSTSIFEENIYPIKEHDIGGILYNMPKDINMYLMDMYGSTDIPFNRKMQCWSNTGMTFKYWPTNILPQWTKFNFGLTKLHDSAYEEKMRRMYEAQRVTPAIITNQTIPFVYDCI